MTIFSILTRLSCTLQLTLPRTIVAAVGVFGVAWGAATIPDFFEQAQIENIARHIVSGDPYKREVLLKQLPTVEAIENSKLCRPIAIWSAAVLRLRMLEVESRDSNIDTVKFPEFEKFNYAARRSLYCVAADPFLWLVEYGLLSRSAAVTQDHAKYLAMSYRTGPNEGWVAIKRNPAAFSHFESLAPTLRENVLAEFNSLVRSGFVDQAAEILNGPGWRFRELIAQRLVALPLKTRQGFAKAVYDRGMQLNIPGVDPILKR